MAQNASRPLHVFLYHAQTDLDAAQTLAAVLNAEGVQVVLPGDLAGPALHDTPGTDEFVRVTSADLTAQAVREADVTLFLISSLFEDEVFLRGAEWRVTLEAALKKRRGDLFILPVCIEPCTVPDDLRRWQAVQLYEAGGFEGLMLALKVLADRVGATLEKRPEWRTNPFVSETEPEAESSANAPQRKGSPGLFVWLFVLAALALGAFLLRPNPTVSAAEASQTAAVSNQLAERATQNVLASATARASTVTAFAASGGERAMQTAVAQTAVAQTRTAIAVQALITPTITVTVVSLPTQINDTGGVAMVLVSAGAFVMGDDGNEATSPAHTLSLPPYYIDQYEVTNAQYRLCVNAGECQPPHSGASQTHAAYYDAAEFADHPVLNVDWNMAQIYCTWRGARLPTEAEWEKAARGPEALVRPWGDETGCMFANYNQCNADTTAVDTFVLGKSPFEAFNMAGNAAEWTSSLLMEYPYRADDGREDPASERPRVLRGGSWASAEADALTYLRLGLDPNFYSTEISFRCARDVIQ